MKSVGLCAALTTLILLGSGAAVYAQEGFSRLDRSEQQWIESIPRADRPLANTSGTFDTRFSMASFPSVASLYEKPQTISVSLHRTSNGGISSVADAQAVFPGSPAQFVRAIAHLTHYDLLSYRTVYSVDGNPSEPDLGYHLQIQAISTGVLGINETYVFATNNYGLRLPDHTYGFKWNLEGSYRNTFQRIQGSWYIAPVRYKGISCTYLRYFNDSVFNESPPIPLLIVQQVTATDYRQLLSAAFKNLNAHGPTLP